MDYSREIREGEGVMGSTMYEEREEEERGGRGRGERGREKEQVRGREKVTERG